MRCNRILRFIVSQDRLWRYEVHEVQTPYRMPAFVASESFRFRLSVN